MRVSIEWLRRYVDVDASPEEVSRRVTLSGFDVESVETVGDASAPRDHCLDVEITWNRPDCQSHLGVAREVAGLLGKELRVPEVALPPLADDPFEVGNDAPDLCPLYTARVIRGVRVGPSPAWLVDLLEAVGIRSINNVVDVTNFVLMETGHPLHAFDLAKLRGARLSARRAAGESMTAIDGSKIEFGAEQLAIADGERPVALAGVMGGLDSEVDESTTDVVLECALFAPLSIRETSKAHGIRSDSSFRFERFVDPACAQFASDRAAALLIEVCGAKSVGPICAAGPGQAAPSRDLELRTAQVERVLGIPVGVDEIRAILVSLGCEELPGGSQATTGWRTPTWRPDLVEEIDLVEEVARRVGFERVPDTVSISVRPVRPDRRRDTIEHLRTAFVECGLRECVSEPFVGEGAYDVGLSTDRPALRLENPLRAEEGLLRRSLIGTLLRVARGNADRGNLGLRLFEIAPVYVAGETPEETREWLLGAALVAGDFFDAKGCAQSILGSVGLADRAQYERGAPEPLGRDRAATVRLDGEVIGHVGELSPAMRQTYGLKEATAVFELHVGRLAELGRMETSCRPVSRFPAVERDLDIVVDESVSWADLQACVHEGAGDLLQSVAPFDIFRKGLGSGRKSVTLRMELRAQDRTLTTAEADERVQRTLALIADRTGGRLRG